MYKLGTILILHFEAKTIDLVSLYLKQILSCQQTSPIYLKNLDLAVFRHPYIITEDYRFDR